MEEFPQNTLEIENLEPEENIIEKTQIKEGVNFIFGQNPELLSIGTEEQYSKYLDSVFPNSTIKQIVYHGSPNKFDSFDESRLGTNATLTELSQKGFFFSDTIRVAQFYGHPKAYLLDVRTPVIINDENNGNVIGAAKGEIENALRNTENADGIIAKNFSDSVVEDDEARSTGSFVIKQNQFIVFNPDQIHTLGSESDKANFKKFIVDQKNSSNPHI